LMVWSENYGMRVIEERFTHDIRRLLFHAQLNHKFNAFQSRPTGKYILRYSSDMLAIQYYLSKGIIKSISDFAFFKGNFSLS
jgi:ABC-type multidrug transport system fused ATPase/permease subunit